MQVYASTSTWRAALALGLIVFVPTLPAGQDPGNAQTAQEVKAGRAALPALEKGDTLSPLFHAVAQVVRPAVVEVKVTERIRVVQSSGLQGLLRHLFGNVAPTAPAPTYEYIYGLGSGIIVDAAHGYILTN